MMVGRVRDYAGEYVQRKASALRRGLSVSQARGHPRRGELSVEQLKEGGELERSRPETVSRYYEAVGHIAQGDSLNRAARRASISPSTVRRLDEEHQLLGKVYRPDREGRRRIFDRFTVQRSATMPLLTDEGDYYPKVELDARYATVVGRYWGAVRLAMETGDDGRLRRFEGIEVRDIYGNPYTLLTDLSALMEWWDEMMDEDRAEHDRVFQSEKVPIRRQR